MTAKPLRRPFQCAVKPWDAKHNKATESPSHSTTTPYYDKVLLRTYKVLLRTIKYYSVQLRNVTTTFMFDRRNT